MPNKQMKYQGKEIRSEEELSKPKAILTLNQVKQNKYDAIMNTIDERASFYRENPQRFVRDYMNLHLNRDQEINLVMMFKNSNMTYIASRGAGKSFLIAVFCCAYCILYPGTCVCICSNTVKQATGILEKIREELMPISANLRLEIDDCKTSKNDPGCTFRNNSRIKIVPATENARFNRATVLVVDEYRLLDKGFIDTVLKNFLTTQRTPQYMMKPEYRDAPREKNKQIYASSAWYENHWAYEQVKSYALNMLRGSTYFVCALPYQLAIKEGRLSREKVEDEMSESTFSPSSFRMENEALFLGEADGSLYSFEDIDKNRKIIYPVLPKWELPLDADKKFASNKFTLSKKTANEIRILSADIALMPTGKNQNDATAIFLNQMMPLSSGRYVNNILYATTLEGKTTQEQALLIRKLFEEFDCDYLVQDARGVGMGCMDLLLAPITDQRECRTYEALSCCNNPEIAARCTNPKAPKVIWAIQGTAEFNSKAAITLREAFKGGSVKLLISQYSAEDALDDVKGYSTLTIPEKTYLIAPYLQTTLAIDEMINLESKILGNVVRVQEKTGMRKDRYSSLSYNIWVAKELEHDREIKKQKGTFSDYVKFIKAPQLKKSYGRR